MSYVPFQISQILNPCETPNCKMYDGGHVGASVHNYYIVDI